MAPRQLAPQAVEERVLARRRFGAVGVVLEQAEQPDHRRGGAERRPATSSRQLGATKTVRFYAILLRLFCRGYQL